ncbi:SCO family protein [Rhizobium sp. L1K21]|uniref:SCO family protein n=1 Tax=Rhizobium sp. L1K21 TaxID=2954933 RepID=UPI002092B7AD|nr:SCO family protein [Rhizobium sp. L1K21]MCO6185663.1 SCO family protein [Rhizobium sp. L1K21]
MKSRNLIIWGAVFVMALLAGWLTIEFTKNRESLDEAPFGVPFALTDQSGQEITQAALQEQPTALFFGYTHCPDVCPTTLFELDGWLKKVDPDGTKMKAFFVTVDPERDTPEILGQYIANVSNRITGISGEPDKVMEMVKGFRIYAKKVPIDENDPNGDYTMDHTASVFLLNRGGRFKGTIAYGEDPDVAVKKLENLIKG